jgi:hypothetical protein
MGKSPGAPRHRRPARNHDHDAQGRPAAPTTLPAPRLRRHTPLAWEIMLAARDRLIP